LELAQAIVENGGRATLFGRTIFEDDNPRLMCRALRNVLDRTMSAEQAFEAYRTNFSGATNGNGVSNGATNGGNNGGANNITMNEGQRVTGMTSSVISRFSGGL